MPENNREDLKVVAHLADGSLVKGYLRDGPPIDPHTVHLSTSVLPKSVALDLPAGGKYTVDLHSAKALFFVKTLEGKTDYVEIKFFERNPQIAGLWIKIQFKDGEVTEGIVHNSLPFVTEPGFFLRPPDPHSNNRIVYVVKSFLSDFRVLGIRSEY
ncbi:MAG: hypothetical protein JOZ10_12115 [Acidobacteria bacterium]|nr:hypothetical protein [Acidobacteriota bacterium]MBV9145142.1 hypothetical protein [Acidobacteriota bacterium]MBV9435033.1 hypothetical protein [Acidobacteriota bacterium]